MYEPIRGGTRGGAAEFKWTDVSADKDREVMDYSHADQDSGQMDSDLPRII
jgi:hypothetical protein